MSEGFLIGPNLRQEIRLLVDERRNAVRGSPITRIEARFEDRPQFAAAAAAFRIGTFSGEWNKGSQKTVTYKYGSTATVSVTNLFADIPAPAGGGDCAIARDGTAWFLIAAECE
jgi:hypothetical protein